MADDNKKEKKLKCPLSDEQKEIVNEIADTVEKHRKIVKKVTGF